MKQDAPLSGLESDVAEPFAVTPGFVLFLTMLFMPVLLALAVYAAEDGGTGVCVGSGIGHEFLS